MGRVLHSGVDPWLTSEACQDLAPLRVRVVADGEPGIRMIEIPEEEYLFLKMDSRFLENLRAAGVDNWDGYHYGYTGYEEDEEY